MSENKMTIVCAMCDKEGAPSSNPNICLLCMAAEMEDWQKHQNGDLDDCPTPSHRITEQDNEKNTWLTCATCFFEEGVTLDDKFYMVRDEFDRKHIYIITSISHEENTMNENTVNMEAVDAQVATLTAAVAELVAKVQEQEATINKLKEVANQHHRMLHNATQKETKKQAPTNVARAQKAGPAQKKETATKKQFPCKVYKCMGHTDAHHPELHMAQVNKKKEKINK